MRDRHNRAYLSALALVAFGVSFALIMLINGLAALVGS